VAPVRDDNPFFFSQHKLGSVWDWIKSGEKQELPEGSPWVALTKEFQYRPVGLLLLGLTLLQLAALVTVLILGPLLFVKREQRGGRVLPPLLYFLCLGLAYIFLMVSAMQRFTLVLGHPTRSIAITMATFLIGSGLGSLVSGMVALRHKAWLVLVVALLLAANAFGLQWCLPDVSHWLLSKSFAVRAACTVGLLAPAAFLMGMCFPSGIRLLAEGREDLIPWAYGVNAAASVLGSVIAVILAMWLGFTNVQWVAAGLYLLAAAMLFGVARAMRQPTIARPGAANLFLREP
jgi:hypothetical protein